MLETDNSGNRKPIPYLIPFKPRQVMLAEQNARKTMTKNEGTKITSLHQKALLIHSILRYLDRNSFTKTLKRFLSEAQIENDDWRTSSLDLEDMCCQYLEKCGQVGINLNVIKEKELRMDSFTKDAGDGNYAVSEKAVSKKKIKSNDNKESNVPVDQSGVVDEPAAGAKKSKDIANGEVSELKEKKKKKKNKEQQQLDSLPGVNEDGSKDLADAKGDCNIDTEPKTKSKDKKKKSKPIDSSFSEIKKDDSVSEKLSRDMVEKECFETSAAGDTNGEEKASKKRKRKVSDEIDDQPVEKVGAEDTKRQKTEISKKTKSTEDIKQFDADANGMFEKNDGEKSALQKSKKKPQNGSAEPKTVNAFQRVKIDDVNFADERLQDNSYWAKDGADIGYGAKAQEVLGQVRGRDFRHEKTKKKRGSYRGGVIDLHSHSVKFNYSDED